MPKLNLALHVRKVKLIHRFLIQLFTLIYDLKIDKISIVLDKPLIGNLILPSYQNAKEGQKFILRFRHEIKRLFLYQVEFNLSWQKTKFKQEYLILEIT